MRVFRLTVCVLLLAAASLSAQSITGSVAGLGCTTSLGSNLFQVLAWNLDVTNTGTRAAFGNLTMTKNFDECSPSLFINVATAKHLTSATLTQSDKNNNPQMTVQLTNVVVQSYSVSGSTTAGATEQISLSYATITITDVVNGSKSCWNLTTLTTC